MLNPEDAAYLSGVFENCNLYINKVAAENERGFVIRIYGYLRDQTGEIVEIINMLLETDMRRTTWHAHPKRITSCDRSYSKILKSTHPYYLRFTSNRLRDILPQLRFKSASQELRRKQVIKTLALIFEYKKICKSKDLQKIARANEINVVLDELATTFKTRRDSYA